MRSHYFGLSRQINRHLSPAVQGSNLSIRAMRLENLNPFHWSKRTVRVFTALFFVVMLPIYLLIGVQPAISINYADLPELSIANILTTPVEPVELVDHQLAVPDRIAGSYIQNENATLIMGHSSSVFHQLDQLQNGQMITYAGEEYTVTNIETKLKAEIDMSELLSARETPTIMLMTCAGEPLPNQDATHRLIVTAEKIAE